METICPCCNKLVNKEFSCDLCGGQMKDRGRAQEILLDDYTANMPINDCHQYCVHIFECDECHNRANIQIFKIPV